MTAARARVLKKKPSSRDDTFVLYCASYIHPFVITLVLSEHIPCTMCRVLLVGMTLLWTSSLVSSEMVANTTKLANGYIRYHYDDNAQQDAPCETVVLMSVGTAMTTGSYEQLSAELVTNTSMVFIMMDPNPFHIVKLSASKYTRLATAIADHITTLVPVCTKPPIHGYIVGGHSAGGQAAIQALPQLLLHIPTIVAFLGLDPFNAKNAHSNIVHSRTVLGISQDNVHGDGQVCRAICL